MKKGVNVNYNTFFYIYTCEAVERKHWLRCVL